MGTLYDRKQQIITARQEVSLTQLSNVLWPHFLCST